MRIFSDWKTSVLYLRDLITHSQPLAGQGIAIEKTPDGTRISATGVTGANSDSDDSSSGAAAIKITGGDNTGRYPCEIYGNGKGKEKTGAGTFEVVDMLFYDTIPAGTWTVGDEALVTKTGGSDK